MNRDDLLQALAARTEEVASGFAGLDEQTFHRGTAEQWSPAYHLDHLTRSNTVLAMALSMPRDRFGWGRRPAGTPGQSEEALRTEYQRRLREQGLRASGRFLPDPRGTQAEQVEAYRQSHALLAHHLLAYTDEAELDTATLPHPALGELSLRELLFFTHYHNDHHLRGAHAALETP
ncbi:DinB family protein [Deinococcus aquaedulcis]|uniref:DinB family protein n=1 Tax=Deinococcus aquaedulcis TaxID=2840455 RepID=UPI001C83573E|nr:DinB family protein [Deinococcus aquaedulcis]